MNKRAIWTAVIALLVFIGLITFVFTMRRVMAGRGGMMMMGGASQPMDLVAVSADGEKLQPGQDITAITGELPQNKAAQKTEDLIVTLELNPYPPTVGQGDFEVTLTDLNGQPVDDASISLDLTMPAMRMPPNQPVMDFVSDGTYRTAAYYTMRGWWRIEVIITRGGTSQSVFFDLGL